jgi:hypothetical protein
MWWDVYLGRGLLSRPEEGLDGGFGYEYGNFKFISTTYQYKYVYTTIIILVTTTRYYNNVTRQQCKNVMMMIYIK